MTVFQYVAAERETCDGDDTRIAPSFSVFMLRLILHNMGTRVKRSVCCQGWHTVGAF